MTDDVLRTALTEAMDEVLEKMFFMSALEASPANVEQACLNVLLDFDGSPSGSLELRLPLCMAFSIAADFLGLEPAEIRPLNVREVVGELANMICGAALSRVESSASFRLAPPRIGDSADAVRGSESLQSVSVQGGGLFVTMRMEAKTCPAVEFAS